MKKVNTPRTEKNIEEMAIKFANHLPKSTNFNNTKTRKYFSTKSRGDETTLTLKDTLLYNKSTHSDSISTTNKNDSITSIQNQNKISIERPIEINRGTHHKKTSSNVLVVSKEIAKFAERKSTPKVFYKIPAKLMEDDEELIVDSDPEDFSENIISNYKHNKTVDNVKKNKIEDSLCVIKEKLNNTDLDIDLFNSCNKITINFEALITAESIYETFLKEIEIKKTKQNDYDSLILKYFENISNSYESIYFLEQSLNDKSIKKALTQFFTQEIFIYALAFMRGVDKTDQPSLNLYTAFKTCFFYLHQNLVILIFICSVILKKHISSDEKNNPFLEICRTKIEENKIWLNKNNFKKYLKNNNKAVFGIIKNVLKQIKEQDIKNVNAAEMKNLAIIVNYIKNMGKYKTEVIRDNIHKHFINEKLKDKNIIEEEITHEIEAKDENNNEVNIIPPSVPFLPETISFNRKFTLVLDLDETLVHYVEEEDSAYIQIRPGAENFLEEMFEFYEIYADLVLDELDKNRRVSFRLYRQHTMNVDNYYIKVKFINNLQDLSKLGRDLTRTLIIDNVADNFKLQQDHGLNIKNFEGDENDVELLELAEDLKNIVRMEVDVRDALPKIREKMLMRYNQTEITEIPEVEQESAISLKTKDV